ncbi:related to ankyrin [Cephalotrichum gorgonifer]|uniref:Related to ankyrin n=1 Tax=Cephalotrichum gorgonifer TaxID=2041049 RepID=A0AAE8N3W7_9PEZI|nr:related to ankyrin [Cephalotrichum gorgonifer]
MSRNATTAPTTGSLSISSISPALASRSREPPSPAEQKKEKCYRVEEIPIKTTRDELVDQLARCLPGPDTQDAASLRLTLARSSAEYYTATLVSSERPVGLKYPIDSTFIGITPLFDADDAAVDIIAVHGLGSHAIGGFKAKDSNNVWIRDFLPRGVPAARVLTYGSDTAITEKDTKYSIKDLARDFLDSCKAFREDTQTSQRPIIFIGHSLGGLVIKEALSMSLKNDGDPQSSDFFKSSYALVFFGVPNLGLRMGKLSQIIAGQPNARLVKDLELDAESEPTPYLTALKDEFIHCCRNQKPPFRVVSYYEQKRTPTLKKERDGTISRGGDACFMVTQESACRIGLEDNEHEKQPLPADHLGLVKFPAFRDNSYVRVQNRLRTLVKEAPTIVQGRFSSISELSREEKRHWDDLNVPDFKAFKENTEKLARPAKGTLQWLVSDQPSELPPGSDSLRKEDFVAWRDSSKPGPLLVTGPPGQGKSVLSNFVVDNLLHQAAGKSCGNKVIYYFCNIKNDESSRTASAILRALIVQLCEDRRLFQTLPNRFQDGRTSSNFHSAQLDELWRTFHDLVKRSPYPWIYCVIDGLDVYEMGMRDILSQLKRLMDDAQCRFKLFCTSRPTRIVEDFSLSPRRTLRSPKKDLEYFAEEQLQTFPPTLNKDIREAVIQRSGGTFLWINIVLRNLSSLEFLTKENAERAIKETPMELGELYKGLIQDAFEVPEKAAILAWIAYAKRPLRLSQLETATAVTGGDGPTSWAECCRRRPSLDRNAIRKHLGTLVDVINDHLYLIHQSLRDFLTTDPSIRHQQGVKLGVPRPELALGKACIAFLSFEDFDATPEDGHAAGKLARDAFARYARLFWYEHVDRAEDALEDEGKLRRILQGPNRRLWLDHTSSLCDIAIRFDIGWLARLLLDQMSTSLSETFQDDCLTRAAGSYGSRALKELLNHDTMRRIRVTDEVVQEAARNWASGKEMMELLLEKRGDEVEITNEVVKEAAMNGLWNKEIIELLLEKRGDDFRITNEVVEAAAWNQNTEVMEMLLEKRGNDFKITNKVVEVAAQTGSMEMMELLLEKRGDDFKITNKVVEAAAQNESMEMVKLLLEKRGDDFKITNEVVEAAVVEAAAQNESMEMVKLLLEKRGDDFKITNEVVEAAVWNQNTEVMELLLKKRGDYFKITNKVVEAAAQTGSMEMMELLLEKRGDYFKITSDVVEAAAENRNKKVMELLLEKRGDEIEITNEVVEEAAWNQNTEVMELLLEKRGDEIEITSEVVEVAARNESMEMMELLLKKRGDEFKITSEVVEAAAENRNKKVMELLLEKRGDEIEITSEAVEIAARNRSEEVLELLLEKRDSEVRLSRLRQGKRKRDQW